ncbi:MAG: HU family DNA-binding protein [Paludibacteraceae bacterium]
MADNKLNSGNLRQAIADRTDATEREAALFLRVLVEQITEGLRSGEQIKINGLGTFRLQEMAPRKSVNVNTGEPIIIPGYTKVVFTPEVSMREMVEKNKSVTPILNLNGQAMSEPVNEDALSPLEKLGRQADEIVDILADLGQDPRMRPQAVEESAPAEEESAAEMVDTTDVVAAPEEATEEPVSEEVAEEVAEEETITEEVAEEETAEEKMEEDVPEPVAEPLTGPVAESVTGPAVEPIAEPIVELAKEEPIAATVEPIAPEEVKAGKKRKYHFWRDTLICVVCLLVVLAGGFLFLRGAMANWIDSLVAKSETVVADTVVVLPSAPTAEVLPEDTVAVASEPEQPVYQQFITTEEIREGSRLTWLAYRYYGNKDLWVYIYDANKDHLDNPNEIRVGTPIRIPRLTTEQQDTTLQTTREVMQRLKDNAINRNK